MPFGLELVEPLRELREFRLPQDELEGYEVGQDLTCELFSEGQTVDVVGTSKGRGFAGVMKRHHMAGFPASHGTHEYKRHGGSIGVASEPGRGTTIAVTFPSVAAPVAPRGSTTWSASWTRRPAR